MPAPITAANRPGGAGWPEAHGHSDWADDDEWPDDLWPDDGDGSPGDHGGPAASSQAPAMRPSWAAAGPAGPPKPRPPLITLVAIGLVAAVIGAGIVLAVRDLSRSPSAAAAPGGQPSYGIGGPGGNGQPGANGALPGGGQGGRLFVIGKVTAVSSTSITIGGSGQSVTAAVTGSTKVTGNVSGIAGIKAGDQVSAQITRSGGRDTAIAIQDPAQAPAGGSLP
jgi:hypothetical protein